MKRTALLTVAATTALAGSAMIGSPAHARTQHCDSSVFPNKTELNGGPTTIYTGLAPGTTVCIKAGTQIVAVTVDGAGNITQDGILNPVGNAYLGISYYAYGDEYVCVDNPETSEDECPPGSSS
jgi:hypothetical protein